MTSLVIFSLSLVAGSLGAILGIGGGAILIPALTLGLGIHIRYAIGVSIITVIATSSGAAAAYVKDRLTNIRVAIFLEIATTLGAFIGVSLTGWLKPQALYILFGVVLLQSAYAMAKKKESLLSSSPPAHPWADYLKLNSSFLDPALQQKVSYSVLRVPLGFFMMLIAGMLSGLLGIGSGILKVLAMDRAMGLPIKVSSSTSNFMIGVTAAASAGVYFFRGDIIPELAAPVALGVLVGARVGARLMQQLPAQKIRTLFVGVLLVIALQMIIKGFQ